VFLAHFSSTPLPMLLDMEADELMMWYKAAINTHNRLNGKNE
jgi:hypothetical protein